MLNHLAVHIEDVEVAVGPVGELNRPKPDVLRSDELPLRRRTAGDQSDVGGVRLHRLAMDQIAANVADEGVAAILGWPSVASVNRHAGGARKIPRGAAAPFDNALNDPLLTQPRADLAPWLDWADAKHVGRRPLDGNATERRRRLEVRIPREVGIVADNLLDVIAVVAGELTPQRIDKVAMLARPALGAGFERLWIERKVPPPQHERLGVRLIAAAEIGPAAAHGDVDAIVQSPAK
ncbi:MAG: hypothetical protein C0485_06040 [Pirellula sp.]|nr:hypothetical protein [Pirellula sp.]